ncbi:MAG: BrnT family toxin [Aridibacter sp.]
MDIVYELEGVEFEWDAEKYALNLNKHGVRFEDAAEVFFDPFYQIGDASVVEEKRDFLIGYSFSEKLLLVVFVEKRRENQNNLGT